MIMFDRLAVVKPHRALASVLKKAPFLVSLPMLENKKKDAVEFYFTKASTPDCFKADLQLVYYLRKNFKPKHIKKLEKECHEFVDRLHEKRHMPMDELSAMVQDFYDKISAKAQKLGPTADEFCSIEFLEHVEDFVSVRAHGILFCTRSDEETQDISLQNRIKTLHWVTQGFLETALDFGSETVEELINDAIFKISEMNSYKRIKEKFDCLMKCSTKIFEAIGKSTSGPASADEFLPALIYIILKSNPALMHSNLSFIRRFSVEFRTFSGETGYYFTNLCSAVHFIEKMNADSLKMSKEVFQEFFHRNHPN